MSSERPYTLLEGDNNDVRNDRDLSPCISSPVFVRIDYSVGALHYGYLCRVCKLSCLGMGERHIRMTELSHSRGKAPPRRKLARRRGWEKLNRCIRWRLHFHSMSAQEGLNGLIQQLDSQSDYWT